MRHMQMTLKHFKEQAKYLLCVCAIRGPVIVMIHDGMQISLMRHFPFFNLGCCFQTWSELRQTYGAAGTNGEMMVLQTAPSPNCEGTY